MIDSLTLVLMPGMDGTGRMFEPLVQALDGRLSTQVIGYPEDRPLGLNALVDLVERRLPQQGEFALLGESFSGPLAIRLAMRCAAKGERRLRALILSCTYAATPTRTSRWLLPWIARLPMSWLPDGWMSTMLMGGDATQAQRQLLLDSVARVRPPVMAQRMRDTARVDETRSFAALALPMLYLRARQDRLIPRQLADELRVIHPRLRILDLDGPHCLLQTRAEAAAREILDFLADSNRSPGTA